MAPRLRYRLAAPLLALLVVGLALGDTVDRKDCGTGEIVATLHFGKGYEYRILAQGDRYTGRSRKELHVKVGDHVKFAIAGRKILLIDEDGKTQELRYTLQELTATAATTDPVTQGPHDLMVWTRLSVWRLVPWMGEVIHANKYHWARYFEECLSSARS